MLTMVLTAPPTAYDHSYSHTDAFPDIHANTNIDPITNCNFYLNTSAPHADASPYIHSISNTNTSADYPSTDCRSSFCPHNERTRSELS
jgi:hypothetical protein